MVSVCRLILTLLPKSDQVVPGIRIGRVRLDHVLSDPEVRRRFQRTIAAMPAAVAAY